MFADARGYAQRGSRGLIGDHIAITGPTRHTDGSLTLDSADARDLLELLEGSARAIREFGDLRRRLLEVINDPSHRSVTVPLNLGRSLDERTQGEAAGHQSGANASGQRTLDRRRESRGRPEQRPNYCLDGRPAAPRIPPTRAGNSAAVWVISTSRRRLASGLKNRLSAPRTPGTFGRSPLVSRTRGWTICRDSAPCEEMLGEDSH